MSVFSLPYQVIQCGTAVCCASALRISVKLKHAQINNVFSSLIHFKSKMMVMWIIKIENICIRLVLSNSVMIIQTVGRLWRCVVLSHRNGNKSGFSKSASKKSNRNLLLTEQFDESMAWNWRLSSFLLIRTSSQTVCTST